MEYDLVVARSLAAKNATISLKVSSPNAELEKLRVEVVDLPDLNEKLAKCKDLSELLAMVEKWRGRIKKHLNLAGRTLDQAIDQSMKIFQNVAHMLEVHDKLVADNQQVIKLVLEDMDRFERVLDAAKVYKLQFERDSWIAL